MPRTHRSPFPLTHQRRRSEVLRFLFGPLPLPAYALVVVVMIVLAVFDVVSPPRADAAERGAGFGTWAPISASGWHGSMLIDGVHTYCITPGAPAPTGPSTDHGISGSAAGLSPQQLAGINHLVSRYGQTEDPVQAAAVAWAVKAIADRDETLHAFGYPGESLAGAIHWTMSALAPQQDRAVQDRAVAYYEEATRATPRALSASGSLVFSTDAADHRGGTVRVDATEAATGTISLSNGVFADSGSPTLENATSGISYAIRTEPPAEGRPYSVSGTGHLTTGLPAALRHYTTPGGQETAGPAGSVGFDIAGADSVPRVPPFSPTISTRVAAREAPGGPYVDEVVFAAAAGSWPRAEDGSYLPVTAKAAVYRTDTEPAPGSAVPEKGLIAGTIEVTTDPAIGPTAPYTVSSAWDMTTTGFYTAVWTVRGADQTPAVTAHMGAEYVWAERFGEPSQITAVPAPEPEPTPPPTPAAEPPAAVPDQSTPSTNAAQVALAATGAEAAALRTPAAIAIGLLSMGASIVASRRPRFGARPGIR